MVDAIVSTADGRIKVVPFGSDALTPLVAQAAGQVTLAAAQVALATTQAGIATTQAGIVTAAVGAVLQDATTVIEEPTEGAGITEGGYPGGYDTHVDINYTRHILKMVRGTGTVDITVLDDGYPVYGPVTLTPAGDTDTIDVTLPAGADPGFFASNVTGYVGAVYARIEGLPVT